MTTQYVLRLYVTGSTPRSNLAIGNLKRICDAHLRGRYRLQVIDAYRDPGRLKQDHVVAIPTLVRARPLPPRRLIGDLSNADRVLVGLDLK